MIAGPHTFGQSRGAANVEIVIPVLNEERILCQKTAELMHFLQGDAGLTDYHFAVTLVDNGSTDATPQVGRELVQQLGATFRRLEKSGVGRALKEGWDHSQADILGFMDLDLSTDLRHLEEALKWIASGRTELVCGSRLLPDSQVLQRRLHREITSRMLNALIRMALNARVTDAMCGFKFLTRRCYMRLRRAYAVSDGWFFSAELPLSAEALGIPWIEIPVCWKDDPDSHSGRMFLTLVGEYLSRIAQIRRLGCQRQP